MNKILIVSPCGTHPPTEGNRARILTLANGLADMGHTVHLALLPNQQFETGDIAAMRAHWGERLHVLYPFEGWNTGYRLRRKLAAPLLGLLDGLTGTRHRCAAVPGVDGNYQEWWNLQLALLQRRERFDTVFAEYVFYSRALCAFPGQVRKILDTHDIFADREDRIAGAGLHQSAWLTTDAASESAGLERADVVLAIQQEEAATLAARVARPVEVLGHLLPPHPIQPAPARRGALLFVGSGNNINVQGCQWFVAEVLPHLRARVPDVAIRVVGDVGRKLKLPPDAMQIVTVAGRVDDLAGEYAAASVVVNPVQFGTGLAIKSVEALAHGRPLVASPAGARGIVDPALTGDACISVNDPLAMAEAIATLLLDDAERARRTADAAGFRDRWNQRQFDTLRRILAAAPPTDHGSDT